MNLLNKTALLHRDYWNKRLLEELLPEPDETKSRSDGHPYQKLYSLGRIEAAEGSPAFRQRKIAVDEERQLRETRRQEIIESTIKAIEMDIQVMTIPEQGSLEDVFNECLEQMRSYDALQRIVSLDNLRVRVKLNPHYYF